MKLHSSMIYPSTLNQQPPSSIFIPSTPNSPQTSPVTDNVTDHLNSSSDIRLNAVEIVSSDGLRDFRKTFRITDTYKAEKG